MNPEKFYYCHCVDQCEEFSTNYNLRKHSKQCHKGHYYKCQDCENKFRTKELLDQHKTKEHGEERRNKRITCVRCENKTFTYCFDLESHYNTVHRRLLFKCLKCDNSFFTESILKEHAGIHKDLAKDPFIVSQGGSA